jgi:hypothetical protein
MTLSLPYLCTSGETPSAGSDAAGSGMPNSVEDDPALASSVEEEPALDGAVYEDSEFASSVEEELGEEDIEDECGELDTRSMWSAGD